MVGPMGAFIQSARPLWAGYQSRHCRGKRKEHKIGPVEILLTKETQYINVYDGGR